MRSPGSRTSPWTDSAMTSRLPRAARRWHLRCWATRHALCRQHLGARHAQLLRSAKPRSLLAGRFSTHFPWVCRTPDAPCSTAAPASAQAPTQGDREHDRRREDALQALILRAESQAELVQVQPACPLSFTLCSQHHRPVAINASCCCRKLSCPWPAAMTQRAQALQTATF